MKRYVYSRQTKRLLRVEEAKPICGEDFCDRCGDCLACYGGDPCYEDSETDHFWVAYENASVHFGGEKIFTGKARFTFHMPNDNVGSGHQDFANFWREKAARFDQNRGNQFENACALLGISQQHTRAELKAAYRKAARETHPDLNPDRDTTADMQAVNAAHAYLDGMFDD